MCGSCHLDRSLNIMIFVVLFSNVSVIRKGCTAIFFFFETAEKKEKSKQIFKIWLQFQHSMTCSNDMIHTLGSNMHIAQVTCNLLIMDYEPLTSGAELSSSTWVRILSFLTFSSAPFEVGWVGLRAPYRSKDSFANFISFLK